MASPRPTFPAPTAIHLPATWTPAPTATPEPPAPTATLVIQSTPGASNAGVGNMRRYPYPAYNTIGAWVDTSYISNAVLRQLEPSVQLASGSQAGAMRQANSRLISLARVDLTEQPDGAMPFVPVLNSAYDGLLVEGVGTGSSANPFATSDKLLASERDTLGTRLLIADAYAWSDGDAFEEHSSDIAPLLARVDGVCLCHFLRLSDAPLANFKSEAEWKKDVDALAALSSHPNLVVLVAAQFEQVSQEELNLLQPWFDYALASFLIGENGSYAYFSFQGPYADDYMARGELSTSLGYPVGGYYPSFGMYARHFQHGLVLVNAGESAREMPLPRSYASTSGDQLTRVRLEPHTGQILLISP